MSYIVSEINISIFVEKRHILYLSLFTIHGRNKMIIIITMKQVRQQDAYLAIRPAYPRGCCPRVAKGDKTYLQPVFLHR